MLPELYILLRIHGEKDPTSLARSFGFNNKDWTFRRILAIRNLLRELLSKGPELITFTGKEPGTRVKVILIGHPLLHIIQCLAELIFPRKNKHTRKVIHSLVRPESKEPVRALGNIAPIYIEFFKSRLLQARWWLLFLY